MDIEIRRRNLLIHLHHWFDDDTPLITLIRQSKLLEQDLQKVKEQNMKRVAEAKSRQWQASMAKYRKR